MFQTALDAFDRNEQAVVYLNQAVSDIERYVPDKSAQPLKKLARNNSDKFSDVRRKLKEKEIAVQRELKEVDKFSNSLVAVEERIKRVEQMVGEVKDDTNEPEEIKMGIETIKVCDPL